MTRRGFFAAVIGVPALGRAVPALGMEREGFIFTGHMDNAGADNRVSYYSIGQGISLVLDPARVPGCVTGADALVKQTVTLSLTRA